MAETHGHDIGYCSACKAKVVVTSTGNAAIHWLMDKPWPNPPCDGSNQKATEVTKWTDTKSKAKTGKC